MSAPPAMRLEEIREAAELMAGKERATFDDPATKPSKLAAAFLSLPDFQKLDIPPRKEFFVPWLKGASIGQVAGWRGTGKTNWVLSALGAGTRGENFGPWRCTGGFRAGFIDGELPPSELKERASVFAGEGNDNLWIFSDAYASQLGLPRASLCNPDWRSEMKSIFIEKRLEVVVFDNIASLAPGLDENARKDWDPINQWFLDLRFKNITSLFLHHVGKTGTQRGTSAREDNLDFSILLAPPGDYQPEDGARFVVHFSKSRVVHADLQLIQDFEFKSMPDETGRMIWTWAPVKQQSRTAILEMLDQGVKQNDVAGAIGVTKGYVSKVRAKAIKEGHLSEKNKLTIEGFQVLQNGKNFSGANGNFF